MQRVRNAEIFENRTMKKFKRIFPPNYQFLMDSNKVWIH